MKILILGGYGFIGAEIMRRAREAGFDCVGLGRSIETGRRLVPDAEWIGADIARLTEAEAWTPHLAGIDAIVNAAGALQDGARDDLAAVHDRAIAALVTAAVTAGVRRFVQISATGATPNATTEFLRTKAAGDAAVRASSLEWIVLKPALVIGRGAYGGTALLRMLAGFPLITPLVHASAPVQTVALDDVAASVVLSLKGGVAMRRDYDLAEDTPHSLREIVRGLRRQLGFSPARFELDLPSWIAAPVGAMADLAGAFGWRSALRSTALKVMAAGVAADPAPWRAAVGRSFKSFDATIAGIPGTAQERIYARAQLVLPLVIATLAVFWLASGVIALFQVDRAAALVPDAGPGMSAGMVIAGAALDIFIGAGLIWRRTARVAAIGSIAVAAFYLLMGTLLAPQLWTDPLGVYVKVLPAMALGAVAAALLEER